MLANTYDKSYPGGARAAIAKQRYIGREDGVAAATDEIVRTHRDNGKTAEVADIILSTGTQHIERSDLKHGIGNAHTLLKEGGMLVLRAAAVPMAEEIGIDEIASWAFDAGFDEKNSIRYNAVLDTIGMLLTTGHAGGQHLKTVVLTK